MIDRDINDEASASLASPTTFFPFLETPDLINCPNLKGWWRTDIIDNYNKATTTLAISSSDHYEQHIFLPSLPRLSYFILIGQKRIDPL